jgi:uncharacterized protein YdaT
MEWYRAYHGMPYDPKLLVIARRTKQPMAHVVAVWLCALDSASKNDPRGTIRLDSEEVAVLQDIELEAVESILEALHDKGLIDKNHKLTAWDKRQHTTSTERMRKHRDSKKNDVTGGDVKKQTVTAGDAKKRKNRQNRADTEQSRTDSEHNKSKQIKKRKRTGESERTKLVIGFYRKLFFTAEIGGSHLSYFNKDIFKNSVMASFIGFYDFTPIILGFKYISHSHCL